MTARLRSMVVDGERTILVLDRVGQMTPDHAGRMTGHLQALAERIGVAGAVVFPDDVQLGDDEPAPEFGNTPTTLHYGDTPITSILTEEAEALRYLIDFVCTPSNLAGISETARAQAGIAEQILGRITR